MLGIALMHLRVARKMRKAKEYNSALSELYYAALFGARAALADSDKRSKRHAFWKGEFNKRHGRGQSWIPKTYPKVLNRLYDLRENHDYENAGPNDRKLCESFERQVAAFLKLVERNTPLVRYPEFIEEIAVPKFSPDALEFDYYCPKSYFHKERMQLQVKAAEFSARRVAVVRRAAAQALRSLNATRQQDYVVGWNSRLGQAADKFLVFLDLDTDDLSQLKDALKDRPGWLFASGGGFHFVGADLLGSDRMWRLRFNQAARARKLRGAIDKLHVEYSLRRGYSTLRVTSSPIKATVPFLCWDNT